MIELVLCIGIGTLTAGGLYLALRARTFDVILGLTLLSYAVNLFLFAAGGVAVRRAPVLDPSIAPSLANYMDPLPQALVLTAIVIAFAMTAVVLAIALRSRAVNDSDHVDAPSAITPSTTESRR